MRKIWYLSDDIVWWKCQAIIKKFLNGLQGEQWKKSMSFGIVLLTLKYQNLRIFFIIKKFCRTLGVNPINSKVSPHPRCIRKIQTGVAIYFNHVDKGHGEHDYNDVQMFQLQVYLYSTSTLFQMKYWSPTAALYANHQPGTLCVSRNGCFWNSWIAFICVELLHAHFRNAC